MGRNLADIVGGLAEWVRGLRQSQPAPSPAAALGSPSSVGRAETAVGSSVPPAVAGVSVEERPCLDDAARGEVYVCFEGP